MLTLASGSSPPRWEKYSQSNPYTALIWRDAFFLKNRANFLFLFGLFRLFFKTCNGNQAHVWKETVLLCVRVSSQTRDVESISSVPLILHQFDWSQKPQIPSLWHKIMAEIRFFDVVCFECFCYCWWRAWEELDGWRRRTKRINVPSKSWFDVQVSRKPQMAFCHLIRTHQQRIKQWIIVLNWCSNVSHLGYLSKVWGHSFIMHTPTTKNELQSALLCQFVNQASCFIGLDTPPPVWEKKILVKTLNLGKSTTLQRKQLQR